jgi:hypothetical protein
MGKIELTQKVVRVSSALTVDVGGQLVALNIEQGVCYGLNRIATRIWNLIEEPRSTDEAVEVLCVQFDVTSDVCREDVLLLLDNLVEIGLARIVED